MPKIVILHFFPILKKSQLIDWPDIEIIADAPLLGEAGRTLNGFVFHYDEVCNLPENEARVIAQTAECEQLASKLKKPIWGIQLHFEMGIVEQRTGNGPQ